VGEAENAVVFYQKGLEVDPLSEDMFRYLISCNVRMGRAAEAHARTAQKIKATESLSMN
jgi:two-component SAPR family response regulator